MQKKKKKKIFFPSQPFDYQKLFVILDKFKVAL